MHGAVDQALDKAAQSLPPVFVERLSALYEGEDLQACLASFSGYERFGFRINPRRQQVDTAVSELLDYQPIAWCENAYSACYQDRDKLTHSTLVGEGDVYLQNPASMFAAKCLEAQPGEEVLDLAAAPGGKTLLLADDMQDEGRLAAVEPVKGRYYKLQNNIAQWGAEVHGYCKDGRDVGRVTEGRFDRVLLDAPCSSESRFSLQKPESYSYWSEKKVAEAQRKQKQLLYSALLAVKSGGVVLYSTCSYAPEENEAVVSHALKKFKGKVVVDALPMTLENARPGIDAWKNKRFDKQVAKSQRVIPDTLMHGFFVCRLRKLAA